MTKSLRRIAAFGILLLGAAVTISAADVVATRKIGTATLNLMIVPPKKVCKGDKLTIIVTTSMNFGDDLAPLIILDSKGKNSKNKPFLTGSITASALKGDISPNVQAVGNSLSTIEFTYTAQNAGDENILIILDYAVYGARASKDIPFKVENCKAYKLTIYGWVEVLNRATGDLITSSTHMEGFLIAEGETLSGEFDIEGGYSRKILNEAVECTGGKTEGTGRVEVDGVFILKDDGTRDLKLTMKYGGVKGFTDSTVVCSEIQTGKLVKKYPLAPPREVDPSEFLKREVTFYNFSSYAEIFGNYGKSGGLAYYIVEGYNPQSVP